MDRWLQRACCLPAGFPKRTGSSHRSEGPQEHQAREQVGGHQTAHTAGGQVDGHL